MINPYYRSKVTSKLVDVEDFGAINLDELPIRVHKDRRGIYEICWVMTYVEGEKEYVLSECGGVSSFDFAGRSLGVIKEIK
ncbi:hypothetical protein ACQKNX_07665 [Lysinibacillus sp. NPDC093712]|uniref:hypothetical protein n=1 Tax=Lysinibacillus sp. NPDC093712 TaxID=3390579 RepID=UPI003D082066